MEHSIPLGDGDYRIAQNKTYLPEGHTYPNVFCLVKDGKIASIYGQTASLPYLGATSKEFIEGWRQSFDEPIEEILIRMYAPETMLPDEDDWEDLLEIEV